MTTAHSPLPIRESTNENQSSRCLDIRDDQGDHFCCIFTNWSNRERDKERRALIVRAVNAHDAMREALEKLLEIGFDSRDAIGESERLAEWYYQEFGQLAPWKSEPIELCRTDAQNRKNREQYDKWHSTLHHAAIDKAKAALALASGTREEGK